MRYFTSSLTGALLLACLAVSTAWSQEGSGQSAGKPFFGPFGLDLSAMDKHERPQDDFYQYVNGAWIARTRIPADKDQVEVADLMQDRIDARIRTLLEAAASAQRGPAVTPAEKAGAMYAAYMDADHIDSLGFSPIKPELTAVQSAADRTALARIMGQSFSGLGGSIFAASFNIDFGDPQHYALYLNQSGLGMPDRRYYFLEEFAGERRGYQAYVGRLLTLVKWPDPVESAKAVVAFEGRIAEASWSAAEHRDAVKSFNPMSIGELTAFAPGFPWQEFLAGAQMPDVQRIVISEKSAFPKIASIFADAPMETLKAWCAFNVADRAAPYLPSPFVTARFEFRGKTLEGREKILPRWKRGVLAVSGGDCVMDASSCFGTLNFAVGQMYVEHYFPAQTKTKVESLAAELRAAYSRRIERLSWMSAATKQEALKKLAAYSVKVGFPDHPRDYASVEIRRDDLVGDVRRAAAAEWKRLVQRSGGPVDWSEWIFPPQVNDAYNGYLNDVVFAAADLEPPVFDPAADDAVNYGAIGWVIGHELTHGFDDQGRTCDATAALRDWWTPEDAEAFQARANNLGAQYARFEVVPGVHIDPGLTMGENIADLGGLLIALDAYHASLHGKPAPAINGLTGDQRFFMSYAQTFRAKVRPAKLREAAVSDVHSSDKIRVLGVLPNVDGWYEAFDVKPGDRMYRPPVERVRIW
ncbi:MAG: M13-type metalloendopeptidase [Candidatus Sulfotelmatobacter sp.]